MADLLSIIYHRLVALFFELPFAIVRAGGGRIFLKKTGKRVFFGKGLDVRSPYRISIGDYCRINKNVLLDGRGEGLTIGNNVDIAQEVNIWTLQHDYNDPMYKSVGKHVVIEDYVWIASRATILPGVTIGRGAVVAGVPAKIIGYRNDCMQYKLGR